MAWKSARFTQHGSKPSRMLCGTSSVTFITTLLGCGTPLSVNIVVILSRVQFSMPKPEFTATAPLRSCCCRRCRAAWLRTILYMYRSLLRPAM